MDRAGPIAVWVPSSDDSIAVALRLGRCGPGSVVLDLGCGDGRVLEAVARIGAHAIGLEVDVELARLAGERVRPLDPRPLVVACDVFTADLRRFAPDVVVAFLPRAMLQRLQPHLSVLKAGTRIVTVDMPMPGCAPDEALDGSFAYDLPFRPQPVPSAGHQWDGGVVLHLPADRGLQFCTVLAHPAGDVRVEHASTAPSTVHVRLGADHLAEAGELAIDVTFDGQPAGHVVHATLRDPALGRFDLFVAFDDACDAPIQKFIDGQRCREIAALWGGSGRT